MPLKRTAGEREPQPPEEQEEVAPVAKRPRFEPAEVEAMEQDRPYRDFVESEARKYWEEMVKVGSLGKPAQDEIRAAAMPILCQALRRRLGLELNPAMNRAHIAVNAMQLHAVESGWIKHPFTLSEASPDYVEALVQLADDARWGPKEVRLPKHPAPHHPPIYYVKEPVTDRSKPREDSLIRGDFVYGPTGRLLTRDDSLTRMDLEFGRAFRRITRDEYIHPVFCPRGFVPNPDELVSKGWDAAYTLVDLWRAPEVYIFWVVQQGGRSTIRGLPLSSLWFSRYPPGFFTP